jgi:hypothetical protein
MVSSSKFFGYSYILLATTKTTLLLADIKMESVEGCVLKYIMNWKRIHLVLMAILELTVSNLSFSLFVAHGASPMAKYKYYYKGEGGGIPQVRAVVSFVNPCLLVTHMCTKSVSITH